MRLLLFLPLVAAAAAAPALADVDYAVGPGDLILDASAQVADGQVIGVTRTIHNLEGMAPPCPYSYFLNPPTVFLEGNGIPVAIVNPSGPIYLGTTPPLAPYGEAAADNTASEQIVLPDGIPAGTYNLVLVLDPDDQVDDVNASNNAVAVTLNVSANPLQITSPSTLLPAILDTPYLYQLEQAGAGSDASWTLLAGSLPPGISLDQMGELSGTPTVDGLSTLVVQLASQGGTQVAVLELPVAASGALSIEQGGAELPSAIVASAYVQQLVAQGGVPPYAWVGAIPPELDLKLSAGGVLEGTPEEATNGPVQFKVTVIDSIGSQASATLALQVIALGTLTITTPFLEPAVVGVPYDQSILASDGTITGATFNWNLPPGTTLPVGITFEQNGNPAIAELSGIPTQAGIFPLVVQVSDNFGHVTSRQFILTATQTAPPLPPQTLPAAVIGENYRAQLQDANDSMPSWGIFSGELPPGLSLWPTGAITGTVPTGTVTGIYPFAATVTDANGAESVTSLGIQVDPPSPRSGGCGTGGGPTGAGLLLLAMVWLGVARRGNATARRGVSAGCDQVPELNEHR